MDAIQYVHVSVTVVPEQVEAFVAATQKNAQASRQEPGVLRFDLLRLNGAPQQFLLVEVYRDAAAVAAHKETAHYAEWRDAVAPLMAAPRTSLKFEGVDTADEPIL